MRVSGNQVVAEVRGFDFRKIPVKVWVKEYAIGDVKASLKVRVGSEEDVRFGYPLSIEGFTEVSIEYLSENLIDRLVEAVEGVAKGLLRQ